MREGLREVFRGILGGFSAVNPIAMFGVGLLAGVLLGAGFVYLSWHPGPTTGRVRSAQECVRTATTEKELNDHCLRFGGKPR